MREWRYGNPLEGRRPDTAEARFWSHVDKGASGDCWLWTAGVNSSGYGDFRTGGRGSARTAAHRWAYEKIVGPVRPGLVLDHLCRNRRCVNPAHLEQVTVQINVLRGVGTSAKNATLTACRRGHPFTPANTYLWRNHRHCRECRRIRHRERLAVMRATDIEEF